MKRGGTETLQSKLEGLDTLSAGIVYGKEDAWEKLQARMEQKPVRKIAWRYWTAAAAILLLLVCVSIVYKVPQDQVVAYTQTVKKQETAKQNLPVVTEQPLQTVRSEMLPKDQNKETPKVARRQTQPVVQPPAAPDTEIATEVTTALPNESMPAPTVIVVKQPMKTYHINELNHPVLTRDAALVRKQHTDLRSLPTVHINELVRQEYDANRILQENRESFVQFPFPHRTSTVEQSAPEPGRNTPPDNMLQFKLHPQN